MMKSHINLFKLTECQRAELLRCYAANVGIEIDQNVLFNIQSEILNTIHEFESNIYDNKGSTIPDSDIIFTTKLNNKKELIIKLNYIDYKKYYIITNRTGEGSSGSASGYDFSIVLQIIYKKEKYKNYINRYTVKVINKKYVLKTLEHELTHLIDYDYEKGWDVRKKDRGNNYSLVNPNHTDYRSSDYFNSFVEIKANVPIYIAHLRQLLFSNSVESLRDIDFSAELNKTFPEDWEYFTEGTRRYFLQKGYEFASRQLGNDNV